MLAAGLCLTAAAARAEDAVSVEPVIVTARLRDENVQKVPGGVSVVGADLLQRSATFQTQQLVQLVPAANYSSANPRNTSLTLRGLGSSVVAIAQSNDGLEPGVGFYVDQVYRARPATAAFDFLDVARVEVLRGPQGTLFGKNTTAGALNITTKAPAFDFGGEAEISLGRFNFRQARATVTGPLLGDTLAGRLSVVSTRRDGVIRNVRTGELVNDQDSAGVHGQLLWTPSDRFSLKLSADDVSINSNCCVQVFVRVGTTLKPAARQYPALAAGLGYSPPSTNPYDRLTDIDAPLMVNTDDAGVSAIAEWKLDGITVTSVTAWRWWNWDAANDRDYTAVRVQLLQHIPSRQDQYSQELRIASTGDRRLTYVAGLYAFDQVIKGQPITGYGPDAAYWLLGPAPGFPPSLLDGYTQDGRTRFHSQSYAAFGEATWQATDRLSLTGGLRYTYEGKSGRYATTVFGGAPATGSLANSKLSILRPQAYAASDTDGSLSGRASVSYSLTDTVMAYGAFAKASKSGGINMSGLPLDATNTPALATAVVRPERNTVFELGLKSALFNNRLTLNADVFHTTVRDFQTNVVDSAPGALRGYLANIDKVRVKGLEVDATFVVDEHLSGRFGLARTDGRYVSYRNGPCPLERIGSSTTVCDLSGQPLSNLPKFAWTASLDYRRDLALGALSGEAYLHLDGYARTRIFGDPTDSRYTMIDGYSLVNGAIGFRARGPWEVAIWGRNLFNARYLQNVTVQAGNSGLVVGTPGDPATYGVTLRARY